jgi:hypothetical protein
MDIQSPAGGNSVSESRLVPGKIYSRQIYAAVTLMALPGDTGRSTSAAPALTPEGVWATKTPSKKEVIS